MEQGTYGCRVSIVVPVYNTEKYLRECLASLAGQTYENIEILLVDDGSTDKSKEICDAYARQDKRIRVYHKKNEGVSAARNDGLRLASGEYVLFVDSDDCIHPQTAEIFMKNAGRQENLLCDLTCDLAAWKAYSYDSGEKREETADIQDFMELFYLDYINSPCNKLYDLSVVRENGLHFLPDKNMGEDLLFNLDYYRHTDKAYHILKYPLYYYRENQASLTNAYRRDMFGIQKELFGALEVFLRDMGAWTGKSKAVFYGMYWDRLYLTARMCRAHERAFPEEGELKKILQDPAWAQVWEECRKRKLLTAKRRLKRLSLRFF